MNFFRAKWSDSWNFSCSKYFVSPSWVDLFLCGQDALNVFFIIMTISPIFVHFVWFLRTRSDTFIVRLKKGCLLPLFSDIDAQINILEENTVTGPYTINAWCKTKSKHFRLNFDKIPQKETSHNFFFFKCIFWWRYHAFGLVLGWVWILLTSSNILANIFIFSQYVSAIIGFFETWNTNILL